MEAIWTAAAIVIAGAVLIALVRRQPWNGQRTQLPPGPPPVPILGNMHQLLKGSGLLHIAITNLAKVHGPLMTIWFGSKHPTIIVSDHNLAWEVLVSKSPDYADRYFPNLFKWFTADHQTIASSNNGAHWHNLRRGLLNNAVGPLSLSVQTPLQESDMAQLIKDMMDEASLNNGVVKPFHHIRRTAVRLLARLCFGPDFTDEKFESTMDDLCEEVMKFADVARLVDFIPPARFLPSIRRTIRENDKLKHWMVELIGGHLSSPPPPNCFAHFLLSQQSYSLELAIMSIFEVFFFGMDSIGSIPTWALALMVHNQEAQQNLYEEIRDKTTLTEKGLVKVDEVSKLEYLQGVMKETMRMKPIAPLAVPHVVVKDTVLNGMHVPKGTMLMVNLYAMNHDPKVWDEPLRFLPERFIETSKEFQGKRGLNLFMPFGAGLRSCAGMEVGKLQVSLAVANLVNAFHWSSAVEGELPDLSEEQALVVIIKTPLKARIVPRAT